jgi:hypothetical protein
MSSISWNVRLRIERHIRENAQDCPAASGAYFFRSCALPLDDLAAGRLEAPPPWRTRSSPGCVLRVPFLTRQTWSTGAVEVAKPSSKCEARPSPSTAASKRASMSDSPLMTTALQRPVNESSQSPMRNPQVRELISTIFEPHGRIQARSISPRGRTGLWGSISVVDYGGRLLPGGLGVAMIGRCPAEYQWRSFHRSIAWHPPPGGGIHEYHTRFEFDHYGKWGQHDVHLRLGGAQTQRRHAVVEGHGMSKRLA